jgi:hypothetical protein
MRRFDVRIWVGLLLILGGVLFLVDNLTTLPIGEYVWATLFVLAGLAFLAVYITNRAQWWALIPGLTLLGVGGTIFLGALFPNSGAWVGASLLGAIALAFWLIYLTNLAYWWAIIPAGTLTTLAVVAVLDSFLGGMDLGGLFFIGLGLTFALVAVAPTRSVALPGQRMTWAFIPGGILVVMGLLIMAASASIINYIWPVVLIVLGLYFLLRTFLYKRG